MLSPGLMRFILDPENMSEETDKAKMILLEKNVTMLNPIDHEKVLNDYNTLSRILSRFTKPTSLVAAKATAKN